jgi:hypothetical protein
MSKTAGQNSPVVTDGEMQASKELCVSLQSLGLLEGIEDESQSRHKAWLLTPKGKNAMSLEMCNNAGEQFENAR